MLWARSVMDDWIGEDGGKPHVKTLTAYFLALYFIMATQVCIEQEYEGRSWLRWQTKRCVEAVDILYVARFRRVQSMATRSTPFFCQTWHCQTFGRV